MLLHGSFILLCFHNVFDWFAIRVILASHFQIELVGNWCRYLLLCLLHGCSIPRYLFLRACDDCGLLVGNASELLSGVVPGGPG